MHEPTGRDPAPQYAELARLHVAGWSDARIAAALAGCDRSTVTRTRKRPLLVETIAAERKREQARLRQAAKRDRDRAAQQPEPAVATEPVAASFEDDPGRGQPGYPHQALGYVPLEQRPIRLPAPAGTHAADLELVKPVAWQGGNAAKRQARCLPSPLKNRDRSGFFRVVPCVQRRT